MCAKDSDEPTGDIGQACSGLSSPSFNSEVSQEVPLPETDHSKQRCRSEIEEGALRFFSKRNELLLSYQVTTVLWLVEHEFIAKLLCA